MAAQKAAGLMDKGGYAPNYAGAKSDPAFDTKERPITHAAAGIDKHLAQRARESAARCCPKCCPENSKLNVLAWNFGLSL